MLSTLSCLRAVASLLLASATLASARADTSSVVLDIAGGAHAGRQSISSSNLCLLSSKQAAAAPGKPRKFEVNIGTAAKDPKALTMVGVLVRRVESTPPSTEDLLIQIQFGASGAKGGFYQAGFNSTTGRTGAPAIVTFKDNGAKAAVTFEFEPEPGTKVKGSIDCDLMRY